MPVRTQPRSHTRAHMRLPLPAMYTLVRVRTPGTQRYAWTGHIYDISAGGMRFELDAPIAPGTEVEVRAMLPGAAHTTIHAAGRIVRLHDEEGAPGPARMGLTFDRFARKIDQHKLERYMATIPARLAA